MAGTADAGIRGGSPTVYVADLDRAVEFYTSTLGLRLLYRAGPEFAMIDAGAGFHVGLHPAGPNSPRPGAAGSIQVGFMVTGSIDDLVRELTAKGVSFTRPATDDGPVRIADFVDPDGNPLYLCEVKSSHA